MTTTDFDEHQLGALEALLFVASEPMSLVDLAHALGMSEAETSRALHYLRDEYAGGGEGRELGFELREVGGGWRMYSNSHYNDIVSAYITREHSGKLSTPALETLAVIAYRQPVTRAQIAAIRGVNVDSVVRTLCARGLTEEVGRSVSGAALFGTTARFLEVMGMNSLDELAPLAPYLPDEADIADVAKEIE